MRLLSTLDTLNVEREVLKAGALCARRAPLRRRRCALSH